MPNRGPTGICIKISGRVIDTLTGRPIELATFLLDGTQSTLTDKDGRFSLAGVREGEHAYVVFALGFKTIESKMDVKTDVENFDVRMNSLNFGLEEVVVTAVPVVMGSSSVINEDAIRHIQPKSLDDMLQPAAGKSCQEPESQRHRTGGRARNQFRCQ
ncbi:MAG: carboxypeptidase-like regulatory domain-containing protein [Alistipes putredinis]|nr:MAG: carboxypeptidase-like regulatory domain-containing protein [Alistipes putredinis]